jgi:DNA invertase Pin-like site-specific DNA recombinase
MTKALTVRHDQVPASSNARRAAQYVRMSTDRQRYSIQNQAAVIAAYAHAHDLKIVRTYADEGESGLSTKNRAGLRKLIHDVCTGKADYDHLLVYDVSRWGRFQDSDEAAHYEFLCREAGVKVEYCAEQFENDGSMLSNIVKNLKRVMAAEYSRELSVKVHAAQSRIVRLGFRHGAPIGYGLRRGLYDEKKRLKGILTKGEVKSLQTDRVKVLPGPANEILIVKWIFQQCLNGAGDSQTARELNRRKVPTGAGRAWSPSLVRRILLNETYIGNTVYNRQSRKLGGRKVSNASDQWVRGRCIEPIIDPDTFQRVQKIVGGRRIAIAEEEMLSRLRRTLHKEGRLSPAIINSAPGLPCIHVYIRHFGSIRNVYRLIGYTSERDYSFIDARDQWANVLANLVRQVADTLERRRRHVAVGGATDRLCIDRKVGVQFRVARSYPIEGRLTQYRIPDVRETSDRWIVAIRLTDDNTSVMDYLVIPTAGLAKRFRGGYVRLTDRARDRLDFRRLESAEALARFPFHSATGA